MSSINPKEFNEMLRNNELRFVEPKVPVWRHFGYVYSGKMLESGIANAMQQLNELVDLESECIIRRKQQTLANLRAAKSFIATYRGDEQPKCPKSPTIRFHWYDRLSEFLITCFLLSRTKPEQLTLHIDTSRKKQVFAMFGAPIDQIEDPQTETLFYHPIDFAKSFCTQIIFETADVQSAIDALLAECFHPTKSPWDIKVIFIQESLRDEVIRRLNTNRLDDNDEMVLKEVKTDAGTVFHNENCDVKFILDVLPKYLKKGEEETICINFFRTITEVDELVAQVPCKLFSVWTEKIGTFYEMASLLDGSIIWSNSIGLIDDNTAQTLYGFGGIHRSEKSEINNEEKYAVHRVKNENGFSKYLVIPFGVAITK